MNNHQRFGLILLALVSLLVLIVWKNKTRLSACVQAAGEALQWVQPNITGTAPAAMVQHAMVAQMGQGVDLWGNNTDGDFRRGLRAVTVEWLE